MKNFTLSHEIHVKKEGDSVFTITSSVLPKSIWLSWNRKDDEEDFCIQLPLEIAKKLVDALVLSISKIE